MSRGGQLVLLGTIWTTITVFATAQLTVSAPMGFTEAGLLLLCLLPSALLFFAGGLVQSDVGRWVGVVLHLALPMTWLSHLAQGAGTFVGLGALTVASICALLGCATSDFALTLSPGESSYDKDHKLREELEKAAKPIFDSGGFGVLVAAGDSGPLQ